MTTTCDLVAEVEAALRANNGAALEEAWYALYAQDPAKAIHVAYIMAPLAREASCACAERYGPGTIYTLDCQLHGSRTTPPGKDPS